MKTVRRVIAATDFSFGSTRSVERGVQLARLHGACVDLLHSFDASAWQALRAVFNLRQLTAQSAPELECRQRLSTDADK